MKSIKAFRFWGTLFPVIKITAISISISSASVPLFINYQGRLYESGAPVNGTRAFGYKLYRDDNNNHIFDNGTDPLVWSQSPKFGNVNYGLFSDTLDFDDIFKYEPGETFSSVFGAGRDLFLRVYVNTSETWTGATALEPVERFLATPFAFYAQTTISGGGGGANQLADLTDVDDNITYTAGRLLVANGTDKYDDVAMSGDATINASGVIDLTNGAVETDEIANAAITNQKIYDAAVTTQKIAGSGNAALVSTGGTVSWSSPSSANTYLKWNGSSFTWDAGGGGGGSGDNLGNHIATQRLDMSNYPIINVATPRITPSDQDSIFGYVVNINYVLGNPGATSTRYRLYTYHGGSEGVRVETIGERKQSSLIRH